MKKIFLLFAVSFFMNDYVSAQTSRIDVLMGKIYCTNEIDNTKKEANLDSALYYVFIREFCDSTDLVSINIISPIKRVVKFYGIKAAIPNSWVELPYSTMSSQDKNILDAFINHVK